MACLLLDIDHFKRINDSYGHAAGDAVLRQLADLLKRASRVEDLVFRYGGEEFAAVLPNANVRAAAQIAERIRALVEKYDLRLGAAGDSRHREYRRSANQSNSRKGQPGADRGRRRRALRGQTQRSQPGRRQLRKPGGGWISPAPQRSPRRRIRASIPHHPLPVIARSVATRNDERARVAAGRPPAATDPLSERAGPRRGGAGGRR
jgi:hypothetical protein